MKTLEPKGIHHVIKKKKLAQNILFAHFSCLKSFSSQFYISLRKVIIP